MADVHCPITVRKGVSSAQSDRAVARFGQRRWFRAAVRGLHDSVDPRAMIDGIGNSGPFQGRTPWMRTRPIPWWSGNQRADGSRDRAVPAVHALGSGTRIAGAAAHVTSQHLGLPIPRDGFTECCLSPGASNSYGRRCGNLLTLPRIFLFAEQSLSCRGRRGTLHDRDQQVQILAQLCEFGGIEMPQGVHQQSRRWARRAIEHSLPVC